MKKESNDFMQHLYQGCEKKNYTELRIFSDSKPIRKFFNLTELGETSKYVQKVGDTENVYFGIATRKSKNGGKKSDCAELPALFIDIDYGNAGHKKNNYFGSYDSVLEFIKRADLGETAIIHSGHGFHIYWFLEEPLKLNDENILRAEGIMKKLSQFLGGDTAYDVSRILRVPESYNVKEREKIQSKIVEANYSNKYSLEELDYIISSRPIFQIPFQKIETDDKKTKVDESLVKQKEYYLGAVYGSNNFGKDDRSEIDAKIIHYLVERGFSDNEIQLLFHYYPTSGKYHERYKESSSAANNYLTHTIKKMREFNMEQPKSYKIFTIHDVKRKNEKGKLNMLYNSIEKRNNSIADLPKTNYELQNHNGKFIKQFAMLDEEGEIGYYFITPKTCELKKMTNFILKFSNQIQTVVDGETVSYFSGQLILTDGTTYSFNNFPASHLVNPKDLMLFITNLGGTKIQSESAYNEILSAIKYYNENIPIIKSEEFGFSDDLKYYVTENLFINASRIEEKITPLKNYEMFGTNKLGFNCIDGSDMLLLKKKIIDNLLTFDEFQVIYPLLAFTFLPLIHPYLKVRISEKPYLMLQGTSGSGKSFLSKMMQRFYGDYENLCGWSSTNTSLSVIGNSHKDAIFAVDDLKMANFPTEIDRRRAMQLIQNYADNVGRHRSNTSLKIRDPKYMRGFLLISAEDIVFTEASTIARGIIVQVKSKKPNFALVNRINEFSKSFSGLTPHFIQYIFNYYNEAKLTALFEQKRERIAQLVGEIDLVTSADNLSRALNNFAQLATSFEVVNTFLFAEDEEQLMNNYVLFEGALINLMVENLKRISQLKPEEKFIKTLWDMTEATLIKFQQIGADEYDKAKVVGYYKYSKEYFELIGEERLINSNVKICLNLDRAYRAVNSHLLTEGGIGTTKDALKNKLAADGSIRILENGRVSFSKDVSQRGYEWTGKYPRELFGLKDRELIDEDKTDDADKTKEECLTASEELDLMFNSKDVHDKRDGRDKRDRNICEAPVIYPPDEDFYID